MSNATRNIATRDSSRCISPRQHRIAAEALRLFQEHGYHRVKLTDIALRAGVSRPTLYAAFANKAAILHSLAQVQLVQCEREASRRLAASLSLHDALQTIFDVWMFDSLAIALRHDWAFELISHCAEHAPLATSALFDGMEAHLRKTLLAFSLPHTDGRCAGVAHTLRLAVTSAREGSLRDGTLARLVGGLIDMATTA